jgi:lipopolysaccharide/colanic/teichoic acid biosynthesis glycosyltransferase
MSNNEVNVSCEDYSLGERRLEIRKPAIFRQSQNGFNGKKLVIFQVSNDDVQKNGPAVVQATRDDARVTPIGRLL